MIQRVFVVVEGELPHYYDAYCIHAVFSDREKAVTYANELVEGNQTRRWPNVEVTPFVIDEVGHIIEEESK
jgi:hypothetical protein